MTVQFVQSYGDEWKVKLKFPKSRIKSKDDFVSIMKSSFEEAAGFGVDDISICRKRKDTPQINFVICGDTYEVKLKMSKEEELLFERLFDNSKILC